MIKIDFSPSFERAFKRQVRNNRLDQDTFWQRVELFINNPYDPILKTHRLSGKLKSMWAFSLGYDLRVVFYFQTTQNVVFVDIGTHNEVY